MPYLDRDRKNANARKYYHEKLKDSPEYKVRALEASRRYTRKNPDKVKAWGIKWKTANPEKLLSSRLKCWYGITLDDFNIILVSQNGVCAICQKPETSKRTNRLSVDHNHKTGKIRGLLCTKCNTALGLLNENIKLLEESINYLSKTNE